jgi:hypothetical protein
MPLRFTFRPFRSVFRNALLLLLGGWPLSVLAQEQQYLSASDGFPLNNFGEAVALDGDYALVGAPGAQAAYVYARQGAVWVEEAVLRDPEPGSGTAFGHAVALRDDHALVGDWTDGGEGLFAGAAYVFVRNPDGTWMQEAKLTASNAAPFDNFGWSVALEADRALVGAYAKKGVGTIDGVVYVFEYDGTAWAEAGQVTDPVACCIQSFGWALGLDGDAAIVGAPGDDAAGLGTGAAYILARNGSSWEIATRLAVEAPGLDDAFGYAVALSGDYAVVGALLHDTAGQNAGAAYVFVREGETWTQQARLTASDPDAADLFGNAVALRGDSLLVGAFNDDAGGDNAGAAYLFVREGTTWTQRARLAAANANDLDFFGNAVALGDRTALVGAYTNSNAEGAAYLYTIKNPFLTLTTPNGGEVFVRGTTIPITWADNLDGPVSIALLQRDRPRPLTVSTESDGHFDWAIPADQRPGTLYRIRVTSVAQPAVTDESEAPFAIIYGSAPAVGADAALAAGAGSPARTPSLSAYPNPFNPATTLTFDLPEAAPIRLTVYNLLGQPVAMLADGLFEAGTHAVVFDGAHLPSGVYLYRLETPQGSLTRTMTLMK